MTITSQKQEAGCKQQKAGLAIHLSIIMGFEEVFSFTNLMKAARNSCKGVRWKSSVINFERTLIENVALLRKELLEGKFRTRGFITFTLKERGKIRFIQAVGIKERVVQKCLCDYWLSPLLQSKLIYDNGATIKGKGFKFATNRLKCHLQRYYRKHGSEGYILLFDIKKYFDSINIKTLLESVHKIADNERLFNQYAYFIEQFGSKGLGLGSQVSQISALYYLNSVDHYIKETLRAKYYARYMDDGYIICESKEQLKQYIALIQKELNKIGLQLHSTKTHIEKLSHFVYLKRHWSLQPNGYVKCRPIHKTIARIKRRWQTIKTKCKQIIESFKASVKGILEEFKTRRIYEYVYN